MKNWHWQSQLGNVMIHSYRDRSILSDQAAKDSKDSKDPKFKAEPQSLVNICGQALTLCAKSVSAPTLFRDAKPTPAPSETS